MGYEGFQPQERQERESATQARSGSPEQDPRPLDVSWAGSRLGRNANSVWLAGPFTPFLLRKHPPGWSGPSPVCQRVVSCIASTTLPSVWTFLRGLRQQALQPPPIFPMLCMKPTTRALRRHHKRRMKAKAWRVYKYPGCEKLADHLRVCSCWMCRYPKGFAYYKDVVDFSEWEF